MTPAAVILLLTDSGDREDSWREALRDVPCCFVTEASLPANKDAIDVVITDQPLPSRSLTEQGNRPMAGDVGVIGVGAVGPADVALPADATGRELRLATLLLSQIVRLRRQRREDHRVRRELSHLVLRDPLTGLPNRRAWDEELERRLSETAAGGKAHCAALIDLDHFKLVNDHQGHAAGDAVLREMGHTLLVSLRGQDFVARLGGDEFGLLIADVQHDDARAIVQRVRTGLTARFEGRPGGPLTASAGFALSARDESRDALLARADCALREAKQAGRDRTCAASDAG